MPKKLAGDSTNSFSIDSTGRVYTRVFGQWRRMRNVRADQIVNVSQAHLKRSLDVIRFQRYTIWALVALAVILFLIRRGR